MKPMMRMWLCLRRSSLDLPGDRSGVAATEFAMIVPLMLVLFFGTVEFSSGVAVDRKVTTMARTLSDLTSQNKSVTDTQLTNIFNASTGIMSPYAAAPAQSTISELYVDPLTKAARVQWSSGAAPHERRKLVPIPTALQVGGTYLIYSEVSYKYVPTIGYVMAKSGITYERFHLYPAAPVDLRAVQHDGLPDELIAAFSSGVLTSQRGNQMKNQNEKGRAPWARPLIYCETICRVCSPWKTVIRRRADCRPKICQSGDLPRFRRRSSGLPAVFPGRHARQR